MWALSCAGSAETCRLQHGHVTVTAVSSFNCGEAAPEASKQNGLVSSVE